MGNVQIDNGVSFFHETLYGDGDSAAFRPPFVRSVTEAESGFRPDAVSRAAALE